MKRGIHVLHNPNRVLETEQRCPDYLQTIRRLRGSEVTRRAFYVQKRFKKTSATYDGSEITRRASGSQGKNVEIVSDHRAK